MQGKICLIQQHYKIINQKINICLARILFSTVIYYNPWDGIFTVLILSIRKMSIRGLWMLTGDLVRGLNFWIFLWISVTYCFFCIITASILLCWDSEISHNYSSHYLVKMKCPFCDKSYWRSDVKCKCSSYTIPHLKINIRKWIGRLWKCHVWNKKDKQGSVCSWCT